MRHVTLFLLSAVALVLQANALPYSNQLQPDLEQEQDKDSGYHYGKKISGNPFFTPQNNGLELQKGNLNNQAKDQRDLRPAKGNPFLIRATEPTRTVSTLIFLLNSQPDLISNFQYFLSRNLNYHKPQDPSL